MKQIMKVTRTKPALRRKSSAGFTLIEVVLALSILASGIFILVNSWSGTYNRLKKTQVQVQLAALLERKIVEFEREYRNKPLDLILEEKEDSFEGMEGYSWKVTSQKLELPNLATVVGDQQDGAKVDLLSLMKMFSDHISKSVKEVKIEVTYKGGKKPVSADVVIYMIDYDRPLPGLGGS
jgi:general secretion pathway protein I